MNRAQVPHRESVVKRRITLSAGFSQESARKLTRALESADGVESVSLDPARRRLDIYYDVSETGIDAVLRLCGEDTGGVPRDIWNHMRTGWYRFTDQNIRDNAGHHPHCCNKPPA